MVYILYNPKAGVGHGEVERSKVTHHFPGCSFAIKNALEIGDYPAFFAGLLSDDMVVFIGGDGTLNYFVNAMGDRPIRQKVYVYKAGTGNDFLHDVCSKKAAEDTLLEISSYIAALPRVTVNGKEYRFLNNVSFGVDGWVCAKRQEATATGKEKTDYSVLAIKGLLGGYKRAGATVTVDGVTKHYKKVWMAPAMNGRYIGGGMMVAPDQDRKSELLTSVVFCNAGRLRTATIFPSVFKGTHLKYKKYIAVLTGREITVTFDSPRDLQIDGEVIRNVTSYTAVKQAAPLFSKQEGK